jgi:hypothetical protein
MQLCPAAQSADVWQATWHLPMLHTRDALQSLLSMHVPPTAIFVSPLQPTTSPDKTIVKPRMRNLDANDI